MELMKAHGFNAIRTSHNPPSSRFLQAAIWLGMLVVDEAFDQAGSAEELITTIWYLQSGGSGTRLDDTGEIETILGHFVEHW